MLYISRYFLNDILTVILKEYWEIKSSGKKTFLFSLAATAMPLILAFKNPNSLLPREFLIAAYLLIVSFIVSSKIIQYTFLDEKKSKTLEVLLSTRLSRISIILGKLSIGVIVGYFFSLISLLNLIIASYISPYLNIHSIITIPNIIAPLIVCFLGGNICIILTLLISDEKAFSGIYMAITFGTVFVSYKINSIFHFSIMTIFIFTIMLGIMLTYFSVKLLCNRTALITEV